MPDRTRLEAMVEVEVVAEVERLNWQMPTPPTMPLSLAEERREVRTEVFRPHVVSDHIGSICALDVNHGLQNRVYQKGPAYLVGLVDAYSDESGATSSPRARSAVHARKEGDCRNPPPCRQTGVLFPDIPSSEGFGWMVPNAEPQVTQLVRGSSIVLDGNVKDGLGKANQCQNCTLEHLRQSKTSKMWVVSINLKDAYFLVPVAPKHTKYLRLVYYGRAYEFQVLLFGLSTAPRVFNGGCLL